MQASCALAGSSTVMRPQTAFMRSRAPAAGRLGHGRCGARFARCAAQQDDGPPAGCSRYTVELRKPLGIVLEQKNPTSPILVASITPGGNADKAGVMTVGDQLISTSGVTYNRTDDYLGVTVRKGQQIVTINCASESFKTVSAAIGTHPASIPVRMTFQRCEMPTSSVNEAP